MRKIVSLVLMALLVVGVCGCLTENRKPDVCPPVEGVRMALSYTFNAEGEEHIAEAVGNIYVYAFDKLTGMPANDGKPFRVTRESIQRGFVDIDLPEGNYTLVAWGSSGDDLIDGGYDVRGTALDSYRLEMTDTWTENYDDLFFATASVRVTLHEDPVADFEFKQFTSQLRVTVKGIGALTRADEAPIDMHVFGPKGLYNFDGTVNSNSPNQRFETKTKSWNEEQMDAVIPMQRFDIDFHGESEHALMLHIEREGQSLIQEIDVLKAILLSPDFSTQDDIDKANVFNIQCAVGADLKVTITVNDWVVMVIDTSPVLGLLQR